MVSVREVTDWCTQLVEPGSGLPEFEQCLDAIPGLDSLAGLQAGTRVLVRGDVDVNVKEGTVTEDVRLRSLLETLAFGAERGWNPDRLRASRP